MLTHQVLIFLLIASLACSYQLPLQIFSVSGDPAIVSRPVYSSYRGGRSIYIKAIGHSPNPSQNRIYVGTLPCIIPADGVTDTFISCVTSDSGLNSDIGFMPVTLIAYGSSFTTSSPNGVYYKYDLTPQLATVYPSAGYGGQNVNLYGIHRIQNIGDGLRVLGNITKLSIGSDLCSRFDVTQNAINKNWYDYLLCVKSNLQEAGKYNVSEQVVHGYANNGRYMRRSSLQKEPSFEFTALPTITSISPATGNVAGQTITVTGNGFSPAISNNTVNVDGNDCKVSFSSNEQIVCTIAPQDVTKTAKLATNSTSQQNGYFSGAGVKYARYKAISTINTIDKLVTAVRSSNNTALGTAQQKGYRADIRESNLYGDNYAQTWSGYFTAPVNGTYTLRGNADDVFAVYLTHIYGSAESATTPLIFSNTYQLQGNFYINDVSSAEANVTLEAGKSYYLEAYHINYGSTGFFDLEVTVPNVDNSLQFQAHQVDFLQLNSTVIAETQTFSFTGGSKGYVLLGYLTTTSTGEQSYQPYANLSYGCSASTFESQINNIQIYKPYMTTVTRNIYDANNNTLSITTGAARIDYIVSIYKHRGTVQGRMPVKMTESNYDGTFQITQGNNHSDINSGTYTLNIGGINILYKNSTNIPYNIRSYDLQAAIRGSGIVGFDYVEVGMLEPVSCDYACTWVIQYKGFNAPVTPYLRVISSLLGNSPTLTPSTRRYYSSNIIFGPVDYRFLNTHAASANVLVKTNGIPSICNDTCSYTFDTFSEITSLALAGSKITLALSDPKPKGFTVSNVSIKVGGEPCTIDPTSTLTTLICYVKNNTDGSPLLVAGSFTPLVTINSYGIIGRGSGVNQLSVSLSNLALSVTTGGTNGGILTTLSGKGFPLDKKSINITVCSKLATIKSINNINVQFYLPACATTGNQTVNIAVGSVTDTSLSFNYTTASGAPTINSLNPISANPGVKGTLEINGQNFGTNASQVTVFLSNATGKIYPLAILTINDTYIKVGLPGGQAGNFVVEVNRASVGDSVSSSNNLFSYVFSISSVAPTSGSINGGTLLTITGTNFSPDAQNTLVYIGDTLNWFCKIESITPTQIKCRTPAISSAYTPDTPVKVYVSTRLIILNSCAGACSTFTYNSAANSPSLTAVSTSSTSVGSVTLTGTSLLDSNGFAEVVLTNKASGVDIILPTSNRNSTSITFNINNSIVTGAYTVKARNQVGETNSYGFSVLWNIGSLSSSIGSTAGALLTLTGGAGYPQSIDGVAFSFSATAGNVTYPVKVVSCCSSNSVVLQVPSAPSGTSFTITFKGPVSSPSVTYSVSTSYTPTANLVSVVSDNSVGVGNQNITIGSTSSLSVTISSIQLVSVQDNSFAISVPNNSWTTTGSSATAVTKFSVAVNAGSYKLLVNTSPYGYYLLNSTVDITIPTNLVSNPQNVSFNGGKYSIAGSYLSPVSYITINGFRGDIISYTTSSVTYRVPPLVTSDTQSAFNLVEVAKLPVSQFTFFSDNTANTSSIGNAFDELINTVYTSPNAQCWIGLDAGAGLKASISRFTFFANLNWANVAQYILYSTFQGSNDQITWQNLAIVDQTVHSGWNTFASKDTTPYRYIRFVHNSTSMCSLAEVQLFGILYSNIAANLTAQSADVIYHDGFNNFTFTNQVQYRQNNTPIVQSISPRYGHTGGGYTITLTGTNLDQGTPVVTIDGVSCTGVTSNATSIICTVGARPTPYNSANTFTATVGSSNVILKDTFLYVLKWSNATTWGVDSFPIDNDLVFVPLGTSLLVDVNTPILKGIAVEGGNLIFADDADLIVQSGFITMNGGTFIAGTKQHPYTHKLTFIMYGGYYGIQQPMFGNKGIGCLNCKFSMYGKPRAVTWSTITATILPGATTFTVKDNIDWTVGQEIVVASTSFLHFQAERRTIKSITGKTVQVDSPFLYKHVSVTETYGDKYLVMQAEVGLLTRNIKMMGDSDSLTKKYGSHLMLSGQPEKGFQAQVAYSEFTHCGQPQIPGRYCIHFHMAGDVPTSFAKGNAVHDSFARVVTIHGVHYLTVEDNVGYRVSGHNFFVQDGIQTHNVIRNNLAIGSLAVTNMLQTDTSVASFWITNPTNDFYGNRAAGSDFYGIWYEIKENPDGPSATMDVCPNGNPLGYVTNNIAHSNTRFGLRVFHLYSRTFPCKPVRNDSNAVDSWSDNPSIQSVFSNFTVYKNLEDGVLAQNTGNVVFDNFVIAENYHSGAEFYLANFTKQPPMVNNSVIIGKSVNNAHSDTTNYTNGMSAVITGRSGVTKFSKIGFFNYPAGSILWQTCRLCDDPVKYTNIGTQVVVDKLTFSQVNGSFLNMIRIKKDVIYDLDGSFSSVFDGKNRTSGTIVWNFPHIATYNGNACPRATNTAAWDNAVMCDQTVTIKRVLFGNIINKQLFVSQQQKAAELPSISSPFDPNSTAAFYSNITSEGFQAMQPKKESAYTWSMPYITGKIYQIWWGSGIDFTHLSIYTAPNFTPVDKGIIFKFNYSQNRELFNIGPMSGGAKKLTSLDYIMESNDTLDVNTCQNGDYNHDNDVQKMLAVCISGKNRTQFEYIEVNGVKCLYFCPLPAGTFIKENFTRMWSNATQWPNGVVPQAGDNVTVNGNWTVILDVDPNPLNNLTIDGTLIADDSRDVTIIANFIHIRAGNFTAGSSGTPFLHKLTFQLNGQKTSPVFTVDPMLSANKLFTITGSLNLYGNAPSSVSTVLTQSALAGSSTLFVDDSTGWAAGDNLVLSPSFSTYSEFEKVTIQSINSDGSITLTAPLTYTHYGSGALTINNNYGKLDTRTRVGHVNRNIKIVAGADVNWGYTVVVYGFQDGSIYRVGSVQLQGVQFQDGGQLQTLNSPLVFMNTVGGNQTSSVSSASFVNCKANCIYFKNARNATLNNNVLYNAYVFGAQFSEIKSVTFTNNLIIGVYEKPTLPEGSQLVACVWVEQYVDPSTDNVAIKNNFCMGSSQDGFALPLLKCTELQTNPYANNTVSSAKIGFILNTNRQTCQAFSYAKAFACAIGQISAPMGVTKLIFDHFIMADNVRSITLKNGDGQGRTDHTAYLYNSYVTAVSRPSCAECYGPSATTCSNTHGMRMYVPSANGQQTPKKFNSGFDVICKQPVYDSKSFLVNNTFDNFKQTYNGSISSLCSSNFAFKPHSSAFDQSGSVYLFTSKCTNCDVNSYLRAPNPNPSHIGWFGGCGDISCTGFENYLIQDFDGTFLGSKATIVPTSSLIGKNEAGCVFSSSMNAYTCSRSDFGVLEYQNIAADFNTRIMWPVSLKYDAGNYTTLTNGWRQWQWLGLEPQNKRFGRFVSIVRLNQTYNMSFTAQPPAELQVQIQKRQPLGEKGHYVISRIYYPLPNSIRVKLNNKIVDPILLTDYNNTATGAMRDLNTSQCGSNIYYYTNRTIAFVVTAQVDCVITVEVTESVQLTTHFAADISTFFNSNSSITNFINNLCALLQITDTSRVKIVGVFNGSTAITTSITPSTTISGTGAATDLSTITSNINSATSSGALSSGLSTIGLGSVLGVTAVYNTAPVGSSYSIQPSSESSTDVTSGSSSNAGMIAGIVVAGVVFLVGVIFTIIYLLRRRSKVVEEIVSHQDEVVHEKSVDKEKANYIFNETSEAHNESEIKIKATKVNPNVLKVHEIVEPSEALDY